MEIITNKGYEQPLELSVQRLNISLGLGEKFVDLLENPNLELTPDEKEEVKTLLDTIQSERKSRITVHSTSQNVAAALLRSYEPNMIIGATGESEKEVLSNLGKRVGIPGEYSTVNAIHDRIFGREKVAVVVLECKDEKRIEKSFKSIPRNGILVISK